jgi:GTP-binding protein Era
MISSATGDGTDDLADFLSTAVPEGPWLYPEDQLTDLPQRLLAAEITREQVFLQLHQELPYATTVETEGWEEHDNGSVKISQTIHVQREGQKAIVLGKGGSQIKRIGAASRLELERLFERRVHLFLFVRVSENWAEDREHYEAIGLDFSE